MASIFHYQEDPPRVSSPWSTPRTSTPRNRSSPSGTPLPISIDGTADPDLLVTSLEAEPQEGSTEYKMHLLLRPRRQFTYCKTGFDISGSYRPPKGDSDVPETPQQAINVLSNGSRQNRLIKLTTQLLWRLEQTALGNDSSNNAVLASDFLQTSTSQLLPRTTPLPSVVSSMGALYEIGVADDGTFVGLAEDELTESLDTLKQMAASLGCTVTVLRRVPIGECEWIEQKNAESSPIARKSLLYVAEAYVRPLTGMKVDPPKDLTMDVTRLKSTAPKRPPTTQLRVTITGATMAGKSSLLGTLTTSTLDNGKGKSRMSLLKHQHEIQTGMTSSVTHEIIGYSNTKHDSNGVDIINLATPNVSNWNDINSHVDGGRTILLTDSAGHPRYRRTTVRGLIGWSPHWTLLCIPADNLDDTTGQPGSTPPSHQTLGITDTEIDLSQEHLELCLKLDLALGIVFTKKDLATRTGLSRALQKVLTLIKRAGRQPLVIQKGEENDDLSSITLKELEFVRGKVSGLNTKSVPKFVPILFTSSLQGAGIRTLHALLHELPLPCPSIPNEPALLVERPVFDVEDVYRWQKNGNEMGLTTITPLQNSGLEDINGTVIVLGGLMRHGQVNVGDDVYVGPFNFASSSTLPMAKASFPPGSLPNSFPYTPITDPASSEQRVEWLSARISSIRNSRVSTTSLPADQVGTLCLTFPNRDDVIILASIRKGMVVSTSPCISKRTFVAEFARKDVDPLSIGSNVTVYFNSVRASAKIVAGAISWKEEKRARSTIKSEDDLLFAFGDDDTVERSTDVEELDEEENLLVTFQFLSTKEHVEVGTKVLVMPGGGYGVHGGFGRGERGVAGLSGFVGKVIADSEVLKLRE
jgi:GTPase